MTDPGEIQYHRPGPEFSACPSCGYPRGFHVSFQSGESGSAGDSPGRGGHRIILICPECGARYATGWNVALDR